MDHNKSTELSQQQKNLPNLIRVKHDRENPYVIVNRNSINDPDLSLEAVGLLTRLLSNKDDWTIRVPQLAEKCRCGKDKIYRIMKELIKYGYAYRHVVKERGKYKSSTWYVFESPKTQEEIEEIEEFLPYRDFPEMVEAVSENPPLISTKNTNKQENNKEREGSAAPPPPISVSISNKKGKEKTILYRDHVRLKEGEYERFCEQVGKAYADYWIEALDDHIGSKGIKYTNHLRTMQNWHKRELKAGKLPNVGDGCENQLEGLKTRISTNRSMCQKVEEKLKRSFTSTILIQAGPDSVLIVNKHKDFQKEYKYGSLSVEEMKNNLIKDLSICFPNAKIRIGDVNGDG